MYNICFYDSEDARDGVLHLTADTHDSTNTSDCYYKSVRDTASTVPGDRHSFALLGTEVVWWRCGCEVHVMAIRPSSGMNINNNNNNSNNNNDNNNPSTIVSTAQVASAVLQLPFDVLAVRVSGRDTGRIAEEIQMEEDAVVTTNEENNNNDDNINNIIHNKRAVHMAAVLEVHYITAAAGDVYLQHIPLVLEDGVLRLGYESSTDAAAVPPPQLLASAHASLNSAAISVWGCLVSNGTALEVLPLMREGGTVQVPNTRNNNNNNNRNNNNTRSIVAMAAVRGTSYVAVAYKDGVVEVLDLEAILNNDEEENKNNNTNYFVVLRYEGNNNNIASLCGAVVGPSHYCRRLILALTTTQHSVIVLTTSSSAAEAAAADSNNNNNNSNTNNNNTRVFRHVVRVPPVAPHATVGGIMINDMAEITIHWNRCSLHTLPVTLGAVRHSAAIAAPGTCCTVVGVYHYRSAVPLRLLALPTSNNINNNNTNELNCSNISGDTLTPPPTSACYLSREGTRGPEVLALCSYSNHEDVCRHTGATLCLPTPLSALLAHSPICHVLPNAMINNNNNSNVTTDNNNNSGNNSSIGDYGSDSNHSPVLVLGELRGGESEEEPIVPTTANNTNNNTNTITESHHAFHSGISILSQLRGVGVERLKYIIKRTMSSPRRFASFAEFQYIRVDTAIAYIAMPPAVVAAHVTEALDALDYFTSASSAWGAADLYSRRSAYSLVTQELEARLLYLITVHVAWLCGEPKEFLLSPVADRMAKYVENTVAALRVAYALGPDVASLSVTPAAITLSSPSYSHLPVSVMLGVLTTHHDLPQAVHVARIIAQCPNGLCCLKEFVAPLKHRYPILVHYNVEAALTGARESVNSNTSNGNNTVNSNNNSTAINDATSLIADVEVAAAHIARLLPTHLAMLKDVLLAPASKEIGRLLEACPQGCAGTVYRVYILECLLLLCPKPETDTLPIPMELLISAFLPALYTLRAYANPTIAAAAAAQGTAVGTTPGGSSSNLQSRLSTPASSCGYFSPLRNQPSLLFPLVGLESFYNGNGPTGSVAPATARRSGVLLSRLVQISSLLLVRYAVEKKELVAACQYLSLAASENKRLRLMPFMETIVSVAQTENRLCELCEIKIQNPEVLRMLGWCLLSSAEGSRHVSAVAPTSGSSTSLIRRRHTAALALFSFLSHRREFGTAARIMYNMANTTRSAANSGQAESPSMALRMTVELLSRAVLAVRSIPNIPTPNTNTAVRTTTNNSVGTHSGAALIAGAAGRGMAPLVRAHLPMLQARLHQCRCELLLVERFKVMLGYELWPDIVMGPVPTPTPNTNDVTLLLFHTLIRYRCYHEAYTLAKAFRMDYILVYEYRASHLAEWPLSTYGVREAWEELTEELLSESDKDNNYEPLHRAVEAALRCASPEHIPDVFTDALRYRDLNALLRAYLCSGVVTHSPGGFTTANNNNNNFKHVTDGRQIPLVVQRPLFVYAVEYAHVLVGCPHNNNTKQVGKNGFFVSYPTLEVVYTVAKETLACTSNNNSDEKLLRTVKHSAKQFISLVDKLASGQ